MANHTNILPDGRSQLALFLPKEQALKFGEYQANYSTVSHLYLSQAGLHVALGVRLRPLSEQEDGREVVELGLRSSCCGRVMIQARDPQDSTRLSYCTCANCGSRQPFLANREFILGPRADRAASLNRLGQAFEVLRQLSPLEAVLVAEEALTEAEGFYRSLCTEDWWRKMLSSTEGLNRR